MLKNDEQIVQPDLIAAGLAIYQLGQGEPLLFMPYPHASASTVTANTKLVRMLACLPRRVLTFDPPGAYHSTRPGRATMVEFIGEFMDFQMLAFRHGRWQQTSLWSMMEPLTMDFGHEFGRQYAMPMFLEEMRAIPELVPGIRETGFYVGGFNWFSDWLVSPLVMLGLKLAPRRASRSLARLFRWSLNTFSQPPYGTMLKIEARGQKDGRAKAIDLTLYHPDGYVFTAVPVVATLLQLLDGSARKPGLHLQAHIVEPQRLMRDMVRLGIEMIPRPNDINPEATEMEAKYV